MTIGQTVPPAPHAPSAPAAGAKAALALLLGINLFNYIDRQVLSAVLPHLQFDSQLFSPTDKNIGKKLGALTTAFMVTYMLASPVFGRLGDRRSRWALIGVGVILWSLASGGSGLALSFAMLLATRCLVGIGEAAYAPVAPSMISDLYPVEHRGRVLSWFYLAIPVGSALGFVVGGQIADSAWGWRGAFQVVVLPGILLGVLCFLMREPPRTAAPAGRQGGDYLRVLGKLVRTPSFLYCSAGMTASTFVLGGMGSWMAVYIYEREARFALTPPALERLAEQKFSNGEPAIPPELMGKLRAIGGGQEYTARELKAKLNEAIPDGSWESQSELLFKTVSTPDSPKAGMIATIFGGIVVVSGLAATLLGGIAGDRLRRRYPGSYFLVSGVGMLVSFPLFLGVLFVPFPYAWVLLFLASFGLFFNTGPANTILANVTHSSIRATAFAINILVIHALGDAISPFVIGAIRDESNLGTAFGVISVLILVSGVLWLRGTRFLEDDTRRAEGEAPFAAQVAEPGRGAG
jgi:MFS family permease